jgi:hypothetical protein
VRASPAFLLGHYAHYFSVFSAIIVRLIADRKKWQLMTLSLKMIGTANHASGLGLGHFIDSRVMNTTQFQSWRAWKIRFASLCGQYTKLLVRYTTQQTAYSSRKPSVRMPMPGAGQSKEGRRQALGWAANEGVR